MSTPPPRTVDDFAAKYVNYLVPVPAGGQDVCPDCHSSYLGYPTCRACKEARIVLGGRVADVAAFVSMAPRGEQMAHELVTYKKEAVDPAARRPLTMGLAAVLWKWLKTHETCLTESLRIPFFDMITSVPSTSGRTEHPLRELVAGVVEGSAEKYADLLAVERTDLAPRQQSPDRYRCTKRIRGRDVLVIDDTWTTGAHAQSASAALKAAGADSVAVLAIGRWFNPGFDPAWLAKYRKPGWDWKHCCLDHE